MTKKKGGGVRRVVGGVLGVGLAIGVPLYFWDRGNDLDASGAQVETWLSANGAEAKIGAWAVGRCANINLPVRGLTEDELSAVRRSNGAEDYGFEGSSNKLVARARDFQTPEGRAVRLAIGVVGTTEGVASPVPARVCRDDGGTDTRFTFDVTLVSGSADWLTLAHATSPPASALWQSLFLP